MRATCAAIARPTRISMRSSSRRCGHPTRRRLCGESGRRGGHRHARMGDSVYLLQPHLKEGMGGLRDLHTALWMAKVKFKVHALRDLVALGVLTDGDVVALDHALDFLWRVRNAMHFASGQHQDHLTFDLQDRVAPELGFGAGRRAVERFMRRYYTDATTVQRLGEMIIARCVQATEPVRYTAPPVRVIRDGMRIQGTVLSVTGREVFEREPATMLEVFAEAQRHGTSLSPATRALLRTNLPLLATAHATPAVSAAFLRVLRARGHIAETLQEMHKLGVLTTLFPEFAHLECLIAHDPFHIYTVDHHSL